MCSYTGRRRVHRDAVRAARFGRRELPAVDESGPSVLQRSGGV